MKYKILDIYHYYDGPLIFTVIETTKEDELNQIYLLRAIEENWYGEVRVYAVDGQDFTISEDEIDYSDWKF